MRRRDSACRLSNRDHHADLGRAKRTLGLEPQFKLQDAVKDLAEWMRRNVNKSPIELESLFAISLSLQ